MFTNFVNIDNVASPPFFCQFQSQFWRPDNDNLRSSAFSGQDRGIKPYRTATLDDYTALDAQGTKPFKRRDNRPESTAHADDLFIGQLIWYFHYLRFRDYIFVFRKTSGEIRVGAGITHTVWDAVRAQSGLIIYGTGVAVPPR